MTYQQIAMIIIATWGFLLLALIAGRGSIKRRFLKDSMRITIPAVSGSEYSPGFFFSKAGTLLVFLANISTIFLVILKGFLPTSSRWLDPFSIELPPWVNILGAMLFILNAIWGTLVALFNPNYTPLYRRMHGEFYLATHGPYAWLRHPRYVSEASLNIILFLFTGVWLPLLGEIGWIAMDQQAKAEEKALVQLFGEVYLRYAATTCHLLG